MCNNQGITHAAYRDGGEPLCRNRKGHMSTSIDKFRADPKPCKRCVAKVAKMDAAAAKRAAKPRLTVLEDILNKAFNAKA